MVDSTTIIFGIILIALCFLAAARVRPVLALVGLHPSDNAFHTIRGTLILLGFIQIALTSFAAILLIVR